MATNLQLSVLILAINEESSIGVLVSDIRSKLDSLSVSHEIIVVDGNSTDATLNVAQNAGSRAVCQDKPGYANALIQGMKLAKGEFILCADADGSHPTETIERLWKEKDNSDLVIASRLIAGGSSDAPKIRKVMSIFLNKVFKKILKIPINDLSSGFRLYRRSILSLEEKYSQGFGVLLELLVAAYSKGYKITEVPFHYHKRMHGKSNAKLISLAFEYILILFSMRKLRFSVATADYDDRAYNSLIWPQRYWQRKRYSIIKNFLGLNPGKVLDIGCGTSKIIQSLPDAVAFEYSINKLRFLRSTNKYLVNGSTFDLPFKDNSFDAIIHSEVIEHIPFDECIFRELKRVLKPEGTLIIGTPDYSSWAWVATEYIYKILMPNAYADEHITHYTRESLTGILVQHGFKVQNFKYILRGELIIKATNSA